MKSKHFPHYKGNIYSQILMYSYTYVPNTALLHSNHGLVHFPKKPGSFLDIAHRKGISLFYNLLHHKTKFINSVAIQRWEKDLGQHFTLTKWEKVCRSTYKITCCSTLWELAYKLTYRWYLTPDRMTKYDPTLEDTCWRNCGQKSDLLQTFWNCPKLTLYWKAVFQLIYDVTNLTIEEKPSLAFLSLDIQ